MGEGWELMQTPNSRAEYVHTGVPHPHHFCIAPHVHSMSFPIQDSFLIKGIGEKGEREKLPNLSNTLFQLSSSRGDLKRQNPPLVVPSPHVLLVHSGFQDVPLDPQREPPPSTELGRHQPEPPPYKGLRHTPITLGPLTVPILL